ncbi:MAG: HAD family hydrolase [Tannerellaceae bacterium]|nr:HAD family hydrolase [Tannerellaceae bacterium]
MFDIQQIKGIIFDYGGTIDSNGMHWAEVIWKAYEEMQVPVSKADFREAYVHGERTLGKTRLVLPHHTFHDMLEIKIRLQGNWLAENKKFRSVVDIDSFTQEIAARCYQYAHQSIDATIPVLDQLKERYPMILVSNFYGNIEAVLEDFGLSSYFRTIVESAVVGVRKPDPEIFALGVQAMELPAENIVVIGDSHDKDIVPATLVGCATIWLKSLGWTPYTGEEKADVIIEDFKELAQVFRL